jgi:hypothetical protein
MDCEKCGAEVLEGADTCPECGEDMSAPDQTPAEPPEADAVAEGPDEEPDSPAGDEAEVGEEPAEGEEAAPKKRWVVWAIALVVVALLGVGAYFAYAQGLFGFLTGNDPGSAVTRMLKAYATYDAQGILDNATHTSLQADGIKQFQEQAAGAKKTANGKAGVKDIKILSVTMDAKDPNKATVEITASWLTDPATSKYESKTQKFQMVKENGKWLVKLFS